MTEQVTVTIDTPGPTITIQAHGDLDTIAAKALSLYERVVKTAPAPRGEIGFAASASTERSYTPDYITGYDGDCKA